LGLIAELARDDDPKISFPAIKTLHNLDRESVSYILPPGIYQFYPEVRADETEAVVDVVFIHGILGGAFRTWRSQDLKAGKLLLLKNSIYKTKVLLIIAF